MFRQCPRASSSSSRLRRREPSPATSAATYVVESSVGHIRDLPDRASDVPEGATQAVRRARASTSTKGFEPYYVVDPGKKKVVSELRKQLADADELLLATDEDREGEAIAWHLVEVLKPKVPVRRMVFHEITKDGDRAGARRDPRASTSASSTRRRRAGSSTGSTATRSRPSSGRRSRRGSRPGACSRSRRASSSSASASGWRSRPPSTGTSTATFDPGAFDARLVALDGARVAQGRDFAPTGELRDDGRYVGSTRTARERSRRTARQTSTFARSLGRGASRTAQAGRTVQDLDTAAGGEPQAPLLRADDDARRPAALRVRLHHLHAHGLDDAVGVRARRPRATQVARALRRRVRPREAAPLRPQGRERPGGPRGDPARRRRVPHPERAARASSDRDEHALYDLVWKRTLASQMEDARGQTVSLRIGATSSAGEDAEFGASGTVITFRGFLAAYEQGRDEPRRRRRGARPPAAAASGRTLDGRRRSSREGHETTPAGPLHGADAREGARGARHRPPVDLRSDPLDDRRPRLRLQEGHGARSDLRRVRRRRTCSSGTSSNSSTTTSPRGWRTTSTGSPPASEERVDWLTQLLLRRRRRPGSASPRHRPPRRDRRAGSQLDRRSRGATVVVRVGRYGPYLERGEQRASLPADVAPDELTPEKVEELLSQPDSRSLGIDPETRQRDRRAHGSVRPVRDRGAARGSGRRSPEQPRSSHRCRPRPSRSTTRSGSSRCRESWAKSTARR